MTYVKNIEQAKKIILAHGFSENDALIVISRALQFHAKTNTKANKIGTSRLSLSLIFKNKITIQAYLSASF